MKLLSKTKLRKYRKYSFLGVLNIEKQSKIMYKVSLFNYPLLQVSRINTPYRNKYKIEIFKASDIKSELREDLLRLIIAQVPEHYKNIVFIRSGLGETYILNLFLKQYMEKYNLSKEDTCFVGLRQNFQDLFKQYNPDVDYYKINLDFNQSNFAIEDDFYQQDNKNIHVYIKKDFIYSYVETGKKADKNTELPHYAEEIKLLFNFKDEPQNYIPQITILNSLINKLNNDNIKIDNLIFISKDAISTKPMSEDFWEKLESKLKDQGYSIFINNYDYTITEAKEIARLSKKIIGLRSGFIETLSDIQKPIYTIYTNMVLNNLSSYNVLKMYSLKKLPTANKDLIKEYDMEHYTEDEIIKNILEEV